MDIFSYEIKKCKACLTNDVKRTILLKCKARYTFLTLIYERKGVDLQTKIAEFRKAGKVTQEELADAVNVTRQTIISLENGKYKASLVLAHKIAQFFGVTIEEMFVFDKEEENI